LTRARRLNIRAAAGAERRDAALSGFLGVPEGRDGAAQVL
jgi:hypothetical protein